MRALAYTAMVGEPAARRTGAAQRVGPAQGPGHRRAGVRRRPPRRPAGRPPAGPGHIVKARYTPMQQMLLAVDEQDSPHHAALADADDLAGMPVVVADLHSALPAVLAGIRSVSPGARVAYVMTDGGALPAAFSRAVAGLADAGWLAATRDRGSGVRGRPRGGHDAHRPARRAPRRGGRRRRRRPGAGQRGHRHALGLLGGGLRRRPARRRRARRPQRGVAARVGSRPPRTAPRHQPPQPHGVRAGAAHARPTYRSRRCPTTSSTSWCAPSSTSWSAAPARRSRWSRSPADRPARRAGRFTGGTDDDGAGSR